jgi:putative hydrolase of the HAD superfamily
LVARDGAAHQIGAMEGDGSGAGSRNLREAEAWIFDLDNTLYPVTERLLGDIDRHIGTFIAGFLGVDATEARRIQKQYFRDYGLTLRGLMIHHGLDPARYFDHMNATDLSDIAPDPALAQMIRTLRGRRFVYTNSSARHAEMVLKRLGMRDAFEAVFDIEAADYVPKPAPEAYAALCVRHGIQPARAVMVDDIVRNLAPAASLGMTTVWVETDAEWARTETPGDHVHHRTRDLRIWLADLVGR